MKRVRNAIGRWLPLWTLATTLTISGNSFADGCFVVPKFVWDKHKDINEPTQKAIIVYDAGQEDLILQVKYEGPTDEFGWLVPVPNLPEVKLGSMKCFYELSEYTQRLWEPPFLFPGHHHFDFAEGMTAASADYVEPPVKVVKLKTVGAYEIAILSTKDTTALGKWLDTNGFYFPTEKSDAVDFYVKQQFYFVAVKINTSKSSSFQLLAPRQAGNKPSENYSAHLKLASGELNPLQISFASDRCVLPLKISSVNGKPSEVQVYVLSQEPLLEAGMLKKQQPAVYSQAMAAAAQRAESYISSRHRLSGLQASSSSSLLLPAEQQEVERIRQTPILFDPRGWQFTKVTKEELPACGRIIPRLGDKYWWLARDTWTFKPEEMRDLEFTPAIVNF